MLFGLFNTPAIFQRYINKILAQMLYIFIIVYLDNILIYTKNLGQLYVEIICQILDQLRKYSFFTNLKKFCFHQDKIYFPEYVVLSKDISMKAKKIKVVKKWLKLKSIQDIQVFLGFANFYQQFIQGFNKIIALFMSMLKTTVL